MQNYRKNNRRNNINDINITPFVDVVLVLLVIFMITTPMVMNRSLNVDLPKSKISSQADTKTLGIVITKDGQFMVDGQMVLEENLLSLAKDAFGKNPEVQALLAADLAALHGQVIKAIDIVQDAGIQKFAFQIVEEE